MTVSFEDDLLHGFTMLWQLAGLLTSYNTEQQDIDRTVDLINQIEDRRIRVAIRQMLEGQIAFYMSGVLPDQKAAVYLANKLADIQHSIKE